jgi:hypothetical protein
MLKTSAQIKPNTRIGLETVETESA